MVLFFVFLNLKSLKLAEQIASLIINPKKELLIFWEYIYTLGIRKQKLNFFIYYYYYFFPLPNNLMHQLYVHVSLHVDLTNICTTCLYPLHIMDREIIFALNKGNYSFTLPDVYIFISGVYFSQECSHLTQDNIWCLWTVYKESETIKPFK